MSPGPKRFFVTGGAGFIGSHMVDRLLELGHSVTVYDNLSSGRRERLAHISASPCYRFVHGNLRDRQALRQEVIDHDVVVHLGANTDIAGGSEDVWLDLENCTIATQNLLEAMCATGLHDLIFASTSAVYGEPGPQPVEETYGPLTPISLYGAAKVACEAMICAYSGLFGIRACAFRFANVVGSRMRRGVIYDFLRKLQRDPTHLEILGDGLQEKSYVLVDDCIDGMLFTWERAARAYDVFNLGAATTSRVDTIARIVIEAMGLRDVRISHTGGDRGWPGDVPKLRLDVSKMERIGWIARCSSDDAVREAAHRLVAVPLL